MKSRSLIPGNLQTQPTTGAQALADLMALRILHLNSLLSGGGTDDRSVRIAHSLMKLGHTVWMAGPPGREFSDIAKQLGLAFHPTTIGPLKLPLIAHIARFIRRERVQIIHA